MSCIIETTVNKRRAVSSQPWAVSFCASIFDTTSTGSPAGTGPIDRSSSLPDTKYIGNARRNARNVNAYPARRRRRTRAMMQTSASARMTSGTIHSRSMTAIGQSNSEATACGN